MMTIQATEWNAHTNNVGQLRKLKPCRVPSSTSTTWAGHLVSFKYLSMPLISPLEGASGALFTVWNVKNVGHPWNHNAVGILNIRYVTCAWTPFHSPLVLLVLVAVVALVTFHDLMIRHSDRE